jgi:serine/threonine-protein kinase
VILYLLLTKRHPHGDGVPSIELMRRISEFDARPARAVRPKIDADLNLLLAKSLARDPAQRYQSADALAQDIEHYLRGDPIAARPPTLSYLFGRRIRTHRRAVAVVSAFFAVVLAVLMAASVRLARERAQTEAQAQRLRRLVELFQQVLRPTDQPKTANGRDKRLDTLDATALRVAALAGAPDVEAGIRDTLGQAYYDNQRFNRAAEQFRIAKQLREHTLGHDHPETLASAHRLGRFLLDRHQPAEAAELLRHTFQRRVAKLGPQHLDTQASQVYLADALAAQGDWLEATELALPTLAMRLNLFSTDVPPIMSAFGYRTKVLADPSVAPVAKRFYETERERRVEEFGKHSREAAIVTLLLGEIELNQNRRGLALKRFRQAYDGFMQSVRPDDPYPAICVDRIVHLTSERGVTSEGFTKAMNLLEWRREVLGPDDPSTLTFESDCAMYMNCWSLSKRGIEIRRELLPRQIRVLGKDHPSTLYSMRALAQCMCAHRVNGDEALDLARESYDRSQTTFGAGDLFVSRGLTVLQEVLIRQGHSAAAVARGDEYRKVLEFRFGPTDIRTHQFVIESAQTMDRARESGAASAALLSLLLRECSAPSDVHRQVRETRGELQRIEVHRALRWCRNQSRQFAARVPVDVVQRYEMPPGALAAR